MEVYFWESSQLFLYELSVQVDDIKQRCIQLIQKFEQTTWRGTKRKNLW